MIVSLALAFIFVHTERGSCSVGVSNTTMLDDDGCQRCWMLADDAAAASDDADDGVDDNDVQMVVLMLMPPRMFPFCLVRVTLALIYLKFILNFARGPTKSNARKWGFGFLKNSIGTQLHS